MVARAVFLSLCFIVAAGFIARADKSEVVPLREPLDRFPLQIGAWRGVNGARLDEKTLKILGADDYLLRVYSGADRAQVELYIGYYQTQRQGDTIHSPLNCLPGAGWEALSNTTMTIPIPSEGGGRLPSTASINRYVVQKGIDRRLVLYWYQSHGRVIASEYWSKFYLITDAVRMNRTDAALVRVIAPINAETVESESRAERTATEFIGEFSPTLTKHLPL